MPSDFSIAARSWAKRSLNAAAKAFLEVFVFNRQIRRILKGALARLFIRKYAKIAVREYEPETKSENARPSGKIWQLWEQGEESAPKIVRECVESVRANAGGDHVMLDEKSVADHVEIPGRIYDLRKKGLIKPAHFSDIVRTALLNEHGGTWIDATVMLTSPIPEYVLGSDLFVFRNEPRNDLDGLNMASYFIHSSRANPILMQTQDAVYRYWGDNKFLLNYFMYLHMFTLVSTSDENKKLFEEMPFVSFYNVQHLQSRMLEPFSREKWETVKAVSFAHKLTHKMDVLKKHNTDASIEGSFYDALINRGGWRQ